MYDFQRVTTVCISPDSTAVAVATRGGIVSFYVTNESEMKFAHNWNPQMQQPIAELFFLDDTKNLKNQEPFWRHCLAVAGSFFRVFFLLFRRKMNLQREAVAWHSSNAKAGVAWAD